MITYVEERRQETGDGHGVELAASPGRRGLMRPGSAGEDYLLGREGDGHRLIGARERGVRTTLGRLQSQDRLVLRRDTRRARPCPKSMAPRPVPSSTSSGRMAATAAAPAPMGGAPVPSRACHGRALHPVASAAYLHGRSYDPMKSATRALRLSWISTVGPPDHHAVRMNHDPVGERRGLRLIVG